MKELGRSAYRGRVLSIVLGARQHLCVEDRVSSFTSQSQVNTACKALIKRDGCQYYQRALDDELRRQFFAQPIADMEDLVTRGRNTFGACPYYLSFRTQADADIIFMPYNYLIDPQFRANLDVPLQGAVLLFDEAHNLESVCEDASSGELVMDNIIGGIREVFPA